MLSKKNWLSDLLFITFAIGAFYFIWLGSHALFTPDEGRYSEVAREMVVTGDYVTPRLNGVAFLDKPALYYWLQATAIQLFGLKEWSLRFFPALLGILGCVATYVAGRMLFSRRTGIISALILATCPLYYGGAHYANLDLEVAVLISISLFSSIIALKTERKAFFINAYVFAGLAFLTKGLIGIFFPMMVIGFWILILNRWNTLTKMHLVKGMLIFFAIAVPWYVLVQKANPQFLHFFFVDQQVSRFLTKGDFNNKTPFWFYVPIVLAGILPWTVFIVQALWQKIKNIINNRQQHAVELFLMLWLVLVFTFFSIPKSKTVGYILPIFPVIALLIGSYLDSVWNETKTRTAMISYCCLAVLLSIGFIIAPFVQPNAIKPELVIFLDIIALIYALSGIAVFVLLKTKQSFAKIFPVLFATGFAFLLVFTASTGALNQKSIKPLALNLKKQMNANDEVVTYFKYYQDLPIYLERRITIVADWTASDIEQNDNWVRELWYGMPFQNTSAWLINEDEFLKRWNSDKRLFVLLNTGYYDNFKEKVKGNIYKIDQLNNVVMVSNKTT